MNQYPPGGYGYGGPPNPYGPPQQQQGGYGAYNPYAAPQYQPAQPTLNARMPGVGSAWTWIYLTTLVLSILFGIVGLAAMKGRTPVGPIFLGLAGICFFVRLITPLGWLYSSWDCLPPEFRHNGKKAITPGEAVGYCFIPFYNIYWAFAVNMTLCESINLHGRQYGAKQAPGGLAIACCVLNLIPYVNFIIAPIAWVIYMFVMDGVKKDLLQRAYAQGGNPAMAANAGYGQASPYGQPPSPYGQPPAQGGPPAY